MRLFLIKVVVSAVVVRVQSFRSLATTPSRRWGSSLHGISAGISPQIDTVEEIGSCLGSGR